MPTILASPIARQAIVRQGVSAWHVKIALQADGSQDSANSFFEYVVSSWAADGSELRRTSRRIYVPDMPAAFKGDLRAVHARVVQDAKNQGLIGSGSDMEDI